MNRLDSRDWEGIPLLEGMTAPGARFWVMGVLPDNEHLYFPNDSLAQAWGVPELSGIVSIDYFFLLVSGKGTARLKHWLQQEEVGLQWVEFNLELKGIQSWFKASNFSLEKGKAVFLQDITSEKEREASLRRQVSVLEMMSRQGNVGGWMVDLEDNKVYWSEETRKIHETPPGFTPLLEEALLFYKEGVDRDIISQAVKNAINLSQSWVEDAVLVTATGREILVRTWGEAVFSEGACIRLQGTIQALFAISSEVPSENYLGSEDLETATLALAVVSNGALLVSANQRFRELFDVSGGDLFSTLINGGKYGVEWGAFQKWYSVRGVNCRFFEAHLSNNLGQPVPVVCTRGSSPGDSLVFVFELPSAPQEDSLQANVSAHQECDILQQLDALEIPAFELNMNGPVRSNLAFQKLGLIDAAKEMDLGLKIFSETLSEEEYAKLVQICKQVTDDQRTRRLECTLIAEEILRSLQFTFAPAYGMEEGYGKLLCTVTETTKHSELQAAYSYLDAEYREVFHATQSALFLIEHCEDGQFRFVKNNHIHSLLTGISQQDLAYKTPRELLGDKIGTELEENYSMCLATGKPVTYHEILDLPIGRRNWRTTLTPVYHGNKTCLVGSAQDITEEYSVLQELKASQEKFLVMAEHGNDLLFTIDPEGRFTYLSPNWERLTGYAESELLGKDGWGMVHPDDLPHALHVFQTLDSGNTSAQAEYRVLHKNGQQLWHSASGSPLFDDAGTLIGWFVVVRDVTDLKEREIHATQLNQLLEETQSLASIGSWKYSFETKKVQWSEEIYHIFSLPVNSIEPSFDFYLSYWKEGSMEEIKQVIAGILKSNTVQEQEHELIMPDGERKFVKNWTAPGFDENGKLTHLRGAIMDITQVRQQQINLERLRNQAQEIARQYRSILESQSVYVVKTDLEGNYTYFNEYFAHRFQGNATLIGGSTLQSVIPEDHEKCLKTVQLCFKYPNKPVEVVLRKIGLDGKLYHGRWEFKAVSEASGGVIKEIICVGFDISREAENLDQSLRLLNSIQSQNARLNEFTQIVSHNLRSHASNIKALAEMWAAVDSNDSSLEFARKVLLSAERLDETLHNLNEILSSANPGEDFTFRNLYEEVEKTLQILQPTIQRCRAHCHNTIDKSLVVSVIPGYLDSILLNVLSNALKYSDPSKGTVKVDVSAATEGNSICLKVKDNGLGIDLEKNGHRLFGMYQTFHKHPDARGFGLFLVKNQIESMQGRIEVDSESGMGSTFRIMFPVRG